MDNIFNELLFKFHITSKMIHRKQRYARGMDLHRGQGRLLRTLTHEDGISQKELAEKIRINSSSMSELISKLEEKELITREKDSKDKRSYAIYITDAGREVAESIKKAREDTAEDIFNVLSEEDRNELLRILNHLIEENN